MKKRTYLQLLVIIISTIILRLYISNMLESDSFVYSTFAILLTFALGTYTIVLIAKIIEESTAVLKIRTGLAGGLIQAMGTALPDMIIGITAALMSIEILKTNYALSVNYAIIAASATFGSNIYNMGFAAFCIFRQNLANKSHRNINLLPFLAKTEIRPMDDHISRPNLLEVNTSIRVISSLSVLTASIALLMVIFGKTTAPTGFTDNLYSLKPFIGLIVFALAASILMIFRKNYSDSSGDGANQFDVFRTTTIWTFLLVCAISVFFTAEVMVEAVNHTSILLHLPVAIGGTLAGIIGCLAEMIVVYRMTLHPSGRIGDAVVGVAMDNVITIIGASIVATLGGIFLGGNSLIVLFILILTVNMLLVWQVSELKDFYTDSDHFKV